MSNDKLYPAAYGDNRIITLSEELPIKGYRTISASGANAARDDFLAMKGHILDKIDDDLKNGVLNANDANKIKSQLDSLGNSITNDNIDKTMSVIMDEYQLRIDALREHVKVPNLPDNKITELKADIDDINDVIDAGNLDKAKLDPDDYYFDKYELRENGEINEKYMAFSKDGDHVLVLKKDNEGKIIDYTTYPLSDGKRINSGTADTSAIYFIDKRISKVDDTQMQNIISQANGRPVFFKNGGTAGDTAWARLFDLHYTNRMQDNLADILKKDPSEFLGYKLKDPGWIIDIKFYNSYLDQMASIVDKISVNGKSVDITDYLAEARLQRISNLVTSDNPVEQMMAHGMIYNNMLAFRDRVALHNRIEGNYDTTFGHSTIFNDIDYSPDGSARSLQTALDPNGGIKPRDIYERDGANSFITRLVTTNFNKEDADVAEVVAQQLGNDRPVSDLFPTEFIEAIENNFKGRTFADKSRNMIDEFSDLYEILRRGFKTGEKNPWTKKF